MPLHILLVCSLARLFIYSVARLLVPGFDRQVRLSVGLISHPSVIPLYPFARETAARSPMSTRKKVGLSVMCSGKVL